MTESLALSKRLGAEAAEAAVQHINVGLLLDLTKTTSL